MDIVKWRDSYNTEIESMDLQHKTIIEIINKLYNEIRNEESGSSIDEIMEEMINYAEDHLQKEEHLLETNEYPDFANHIAIHQLYRDKLKSLTEKSKKGDDATARDIYLFLRRWWTQHIMTEDQKYSEFIKKSEHKQN